MHQPNFYRSCVSPVLFCFDSEWIHRATLRACRAMGLFPGIRKALQRHYAFDDLRLHTSVAGIDFPNPVGLPGGFDKNGLAVEMLQTAGFGFVEVGSVSLHPSPGNRVRPRLFRLPADESLMVFYGVPSDGAQEVCRRLADVHPAVPLGVNLVETNTGRMGDPDRVIEELTDAARPFLQIADYIVLALNCPNSAEGLSAFEDIANLERLLESFRRYDRLPPVFLKMRFPDGPAAIDKVFEVVDPFSFIRGFIPNVGVKKPYAGLRTPQARVDRMRGGITGPLSRQRTNEVIRNLYTRMDRTRYVLVSAGGISCAEDAYERIRMGASLVQVYTALVYHGPGLVKQIKEGLCRLLERDGLRSIGDAVGLDIGARNTRAQAVSA